MTTLMVVILGLFALSALALWIGAVLEARRYRGPMLITCPETGGREAVAVDWRHAAASGLIAAPELRLQECTRWPERQDCAQLCLRQIETAPDACRVRSILTSWYGGKTCAICRRPFGEIHWHDHKPALVDGGQRTLEWSEVAPRGLEGVLATHRPVCWNCHIASTFRRTHPDLVVDRDRWPPSPQA
jgi:hypothetical protein